MAPRHAHDRVGSGHGAHSTTPWETNDGSTARSSAWGRTAGDTHESLAEQVADAPLLQVEAHVQSVCSATGHPITFVATPEGIRDLLPTTSVLSLILPAGRCDCVRGTFCEQSLFFQTEEAASPWMALHPEAMLLSVEEAAALGQITALRWPR